MNNESRDPQVPVLVTSRRTGYEQAPLDPSIFSVYHLAELNENKVREYTHKWFALDEGLQSFVVVGDS
jgi:hypothetical protein